MDSESALGEGQRAPSRTSKRARWRFVGELFFVLILSRVAAPVSNLQHQTALKDATKGQRNEA